jgi:hypothetical protein
MPLIHAITEAVTTPGTPRPSASVSYQGTSTVSVAVQPVCPTWLTADPATVLTVEAQQSFDDGNTWENFAQLDTSPPKVGRLSGKIPNMVCQMTDNLGERRVRIVLSVTNVALTCGVDVTV